MKKNENSPKNGEERKGFWRIGYLENQEYPRRMMELTRRQVDHAELDTQIEKARTDKREIYMDINFREIKEQESVYAFFPTGQRAYHSNKEIIGGFYRMDSKQKWKGVYLEQETDVLKQILSNQRQRSALEDYTYIYDYRHIAKVCNQEFAYKRTTDEWANYVGGIFIQREKDNQIFSFPTGSYFPAEELSEDGSKMFFWMERNDKPGAKQKGFGISLVTRDDLLEKWSEYQHKYTIDRLIFSSWEAQEHFISEVAATAMPENWGRLNNGGGPESQFGFPVLRSYLEYTLIRLRYLDNETEHQGGYILREDDRVYYNTGLLNKFFRQILVGAYLTTITQTVPGLGNHTFEYFYDPYIIVSGHDTKFPTEKGLLDFPKLANYFEKKEDVLYDASLEIMLNDEHIFEDGLEEGRIPMFKDEYERVKNDPDEVKNLHVRVQARVQIAIQRARLLAERNHKLAVPQFWRESSEVQFLLPLYMEEAEYTGQPQCALALRRSKNGRYYEGTTILSLDMAYNNARLIAKPDVTWLNRGTCTEREPIEIQPLYIKPPMKEEIVPRSPVVKMETSYVTEAEETTLAVAEKVQKPATVKPTPVKAAPVKKKAPKEVAKQEKPKENGNIKEKEKPVMHNVSDKNIGRQTTMKKITSRPSGKGLRGEVMGSVGTVARSSLKHPVPHYTGGELKVKIVNINPQGNQYILEPME